jgi:hypothetical protein
MAMTRGRMAFREVPMEGVEHRLEFNLVQTNMEGHFMGPGQN